MRSGCGIVSCFGQPYQVRSFLCGYFVDFEVCPTPRLLRCSQGCKTLNYATGERRCSMLMIQSNRISLGLPLTSCQPRVDLLDTEVLTFHYQMASSG